MTLISEEGIDLFTFAHYCDRVFSPSSVLAEYQDVVFHAHHAEHATPLTLMTPEPGKTHVFVATQLAEDTRLYLECQSREVFQAFLRANRYVMHEPDHVYIAQTCACAPISPASCQIRYLSRADEPAYNRFFRSVDDEERESALVELDHWRVWGVFVDGNLMAMCSAYRWQETQLADFGVITLPSHRRLGFAKMLLRQAFFDVQQEGYLAQCRCQIDNLPSQKLAESLGLTWMGQWQPMLFKNHR